jgi:ribonuclease PH
MRHHPTGRANDAMRTLSFDIGFNTHAEGSCLVRCGKTIVLCNATIEEEIPNWMKGKNLGGWITAEYSMIPRATHTRNKRERDKISGRTHEIQRLIGRSLRCMLDLKKLGDRTIHLDCDVLQADGGTRTTAINGACVALGLALGKLIQQNKIPASAWIDTTQAISVGLFDQTFLVDLDYIEDSSGDVDMNIVRTGSGKYIEIQGTAEKKPFDQAQLNSFLETSTDALNLIRDRQLQVFESQQIRFPDLKI